MGCQVEASVQTVLESYTHRNSTDSAQLLIYAGIELYVRETLHPRPAYPFPNSSPRDGIPAKGCDGGTI